MEFKLSGSAQEAYILKLMEQHLMKNLGNKIIVTNLNGKTGVVTLFLNLYDTLSQLNFFFK